MAAVAAVDMGEAVCEMVAVGNDAVTVDQKTDIQPEQVQWPLAAVQHSQ